MTYPFTLLRTCVEGISPISNFSTAATYVFHSSNLMLPFCDLDNVNKLNGATEWSQGR